jgi:formylglycine-generating enzyme required for sulfatase activity
MSLRRLGALALVAAMAGAPAVSAPVATTSARPTLVVDLGGGVSLELVLVRAGAFRQGSPATETGRADDETPREVTISRDFYIGKFPVTRGQFARFTTETGYRTEAEKGVSGGFGFDGKGLVQAREYTWRRPGFSQDDNHPVVMVAFDDAQAFAQWLSRKARRSVALPTEAQWEMACRAGSQTPFYSGSTTEDAQTIAWFKANAGNGTRAVGQKTPNALGLFDMAGNVYEWCRDWYGPYASGAVTDPEETRSNLSDKPRRILRGGSWLKDVRNVRCAARYRNTAGSRNADNGFRVVAGVEETAAAAAAPPRAPGGAPATDATAPWMRYAMAGVVLACFAFSVAAVIAIVRSLVSNLPKPQGVRTKPAPDGFWIHAPDYTRGRRISYRAIVDGAARDGLIDSPGEQGEFVYTGGTVSEVQILSMAPVSAMGTAMDDEEWRRRQREEEEQRSRDDSRFTGFPSAY